MFCLSQFNTDYSKYPNLSAFVDSRQKTLQFTINGYMKMTEGGIIDVQFPVENCIKTAENERFSTLCILHRRRYHQHQVHDGSSEISGGCTQPWYKLHNIYLPLRFWCFKHRVASFTRDLVLVQDVVIFWIRDEPLQEGAIRPRTAVTSRVPTNRCWRVARARATSVRSM